MNRFQGKSVVITGAGSGIGRATAERLGREGANLVLVDVNLTGLEATRAAIESGGAQGRVITRTADVAVEAEVRGYMSAAVDAFGTVDGFSTMPASRGSRISLRTSGLRSSTGCCRSTSRVSSTA